MVGSRVWLEHNRLRWFPAGILASLLLAVAALGLGTLNAIIVAEAAAGTCFLLAYEVMRPIFRSVAMDRAAAWTAHALTWGLIALFLVAFAVAKLSRQKLSFAMNGDVVESIWYGAPAAAFAWTAGVLVWQRGTKGEFTVWCTAVFGVAAAVTVFATSTITDSNLISLLLLPTYAAGAVILFVPVRRILVPAKAQSSRHRDEKDRELFVADMRRVADKGDVVPLEKV